MNEYVNHLDQPVGKPLPHWTAALEPPRTPMVGQHCRVEPLQTSLHTAALWEAFRSHRDHSSWTYLPYGPFDDFAAFEEWLSNIGQDSDPLFHVICDVNGRPLGIASYLRIKPLAGSIEVGHLHYAPQLQRTMMSTEAMFLMMSRAFDELGYRRYEWKCDSLNSPSRNAAQRLGFRFEGIFRQATTYKGRNRDTAWFSIIDEEWPAVKRAFEAWLNPTNQDEQGVQRQTLSALIDEYR